MDVLADLLSFAEPRAASAKLLSAGGRWALAFPAYDGLKFMGVERGACRLAMDGEEPVALARGDCVLLSTGQPFLLGSDLAAPAAAAETVYAQAAQGGVVRINDGTDFLLAGVRFTLEHMRAGNLSGAIPPVIRLAGEGGTAALRWSLQQLRDELRTPRPAGDLVVHHHSQLLLVQALRQYLAEGAAGWGSLGALADPRLAAALAALHDRPGARWTVGSLAREAGMSRTAFATAFARTTGTTPLDYLTRWRMALAGKRLALGREKAATIGASLGYRSESAFGSAFRRTMGMSLREWRRS